MQAQPYQFQSRATGNWNAIGSWNYWNGSAWVAATAATSFPTAANSTAITIQSAHTITQPGAGLQVDNLTIAGTLQLTAATTVADGTGTDVTINSTGTLTFGASGTLTLSISGQVINNGTINHTGTTFTINASGSIENNNTLIVASSKTINNSGTITNSGTISSGGTFGVLNFLAGSFYKHNFTSGAGSIPKAAWNATSTCEILASSGYNGPANLNQSFGHFTWNCSTQVGSRNFLAQLGASSPAVKGNLTIQNTNGNELILDSLTALTLLINGNFTISSGTVVATNGTGIITISCLGNFTLSSGAQFDLSRSSTNAYLNVAKDFIHSAGGIFCETGTSTNSRVMINGGTAALTQNIESPGFSSGSLLEFSIAQTGTTTTTCKIPTGKTFVVNPGTIFNLNSNGSNTAGIAEFTVDGTFQIKTFSWFFLSSPLAHVNGTWENYDNNTVDTKTDSLQLQFKAGSTYVHNADGGQVPSALWAASSTVEISSGLVSADSVGNGGQYFGNVLWNSSAQNSYCWFGVAAGSKPFNLQGDFSVSQTGSGWLRFPDANFTIGGDLIVQNNARLQIAYDEALFSPATRTITINGDVNISGASQFSVGSPNTLSVPETANKVRDYTLSLKGNFSHSSPASMETFILRSFNGTANDACYRLSLEFTGNNTQTIAMDTSYQNLVTYSGNGVANDAVDDDFRLYNLFRVSVAGTGTKLKALSDLKYSVLAVAATDTFDLSNATYTVLDCGYLLASGASSVPSTTFAANSVFEMGSSVLKDASGAGTITIPATAELRTKHAQGLSTTAGTGCIQITGTRTLSSANFTYNGDAAQVTGNGLPTSITGTLEIDNSTALLSGGVTCSQGISIASGGILKLTQGKLLTASTTFTMAAGSSVSPTGGQPTSFVDGAMRKLGNAAFVFPLGDDATWARLGISAPSVATDNFSAQYIRLNPSTAVGTALATGVDHISELEYWQITRVAGTSIPSVSLYWENGTSEHGITSASTTDLHVGQWMNSSGMKWVDKGASAVSGTAAGSGTVTNLTALTFTTGTAHPITFLAPNTVNPLPVELLSFDGVAASEGNLLHWVTATELNNDYFILEKSTDADHFYSIARLQGNGTTLSENTYEYTDAAPQKTINYYRLKQVDFNGDHTYSSVIAIDNSNIVTTMNIFPNPAVGPVQINLLGPARSLCIFNPQGQIILNEESPGSSLTFNPPASGIYLLRMISDTGVIRCERIIIQ
jgi:hypothetical protein